MMNELKARVYAALREGGRGCFLRDARADDALWVSDLPRHIAELTLAQNRLDELGVSCRLDADARLWYLDPSPQSYQALVEALPTEPPALPQDERLHPACALARLLLLHPAPFAQQPLAPLRRVLKLAGGEREPMLRAIPALHAECAALLRKKLPLPSAAGRVLAAWLIQQTTNKEERPS